MYEIYITGFKYLSYILNKINIILVTTIIIIIASVMLGNTEFASLANSQPQINATTGLNALPVLLIHGYNSDASAWKKWEGLLKNDGIPFYPITFKQSDDKCGSVLDHARELNNIVQQIQNMTGSKQVNIVGHSKGGLDARVFLAYGTDAVANLIMIGTPNDGSPIAEISDPCKPAVYDLRPGANATKAIMNPKTKYYTIAGDWVPNIQGNPAIPGNDDGLVAVASVESQGYFKNLGHISYRHEKLLEEEDVYKLAQTILIGHK
jgi:pimeloyl-ACP methyl ester carboxylesterase